MIFFDRQMRFLVRSWAFSVWKWHCWRPNSTSGYNKEIWVVKWAVGMKMTFRRSMIMRLRVVEVRLIAWKWDLGLKIRLRYENEILEIEIFWHKCEILGMHVSILVVNIRLSGRKGHFSVWNWDSVKNRKNIRGTPNPHSLLDRIFWVISRFRVFCSF